jgi:predicted lysophospholipase L1 biosynthesis ABC-type transport system permease subunit
MKEIPEYEKDIASIRSIMERSAKFISLSGLSGVMSGIYAVSGALGAYYLLYYPYSPFGFRFYYANEKEVVVKLLVIGFVVLAASLITGYLLSRKKSKRLDIAIWNKASQQLLQDLLIPLVTGGLFIIILLSRGYFVIVASACLIFYGLALINGSRTTFKELRYLGFTEIVLGLVSALLPGYGLIFWAVGFGGMHIVYGVLMHYRYDR